MEPVKSIDGYILCVTNLHEDTTEEEIIDAFMETAEVKEIQLNQDRRTGLGKGYAFVLIQSKSDAEASLQNLNG